MESWDEKVSNLWILLYIQRQHAAKFPLFLFAIFAELCTLTQSRLCLVLRDQLHQTGQGAAGGRGPAPGHAGGGGHETSGWRLARALAAHRPNCCHRQNGPSEKQEKPDVSASPLSARDCRLSSSHCRSVKRTDVYSVLVILHIATHVISWEGHSRLGAEVVVVIPINPD